MGPMRQFFDYLRFERSPHAIKSLDGLRAIAIGLVLFRHAIHPFRDAAKPSLLFLGYDWMIPMANGWMGVDLFFVLSGFLVTHHLLKRSGKTITGPDVWDYLVRRFLRIVPAYYAVVCLIVLGLIPGYSVPSEGLSLQLVRHLLFLQDYYPSQLMASFWSLGVEEKFYFAIPFLVMPLMKLPTARERVRRLALWMALPISLRLLTYLSHPNVALQYSSCFFALRSPFHLAVDGLLVGTMCAFLVHHVDEFPRLRNRRFQSILFWSGAGLGLILLCSHELLREIHWFEATLLFPVLALCGGALLLPLVLRRNEPAGFLDSPMLFFFSKISYALYLVHMLFVASLWRWAMQWNWYANLSPASQFVVYFPLYLGVSLVAALLLHYVVEKPCLFLKDRPRSAPAYPVVAASRLEVVTLREAAQ